MMAAARSTVVLRKLRGALEGVATIT